jgi:hypothetical protein
LAKHLAADPKPVAIFRRVGLHKPFNGLTNTTGSLPAARRLRPISKTGLVQATICRSPSLLCDELTSYAKKIASALIAALISSND